jgi:hypothetical protein
MAELIDKIIDNIRLSEREDWWDESSCAELEVELKRLRSELRFLSTESIILLAATLTSGISWQCDCGRTLERDGHGPITMREKGLEHDAGKET